MMQMTHDAHAHANAHTRAPTQISELDQQLQSKLSEVSILEQHNQRLKLRSRILELVISARDRQVQIAGLTRDVC